MAKIVSVHSFRGGTGKSNVTASLAAAMAAAGQRVGVVDADIQSPGIHVLFGLTSDRMYHALNDYLQGDCTIQETAYDVTPTQGVAGQISGQIYLIPSSLDARDIAKIVREGYDIALLNAGLRELNDGLQLDTLLIDTHPGLNQETLLSIAISDTLLIVLRPDQQDFQGTAVTATVAQKLEVPETLLVVNKVPPSFAQESVRQRVEEAYGCRVGAVLPHANEMMDLASGGIFTLAYPDHAISQSLQALAQDVSS